MKVNGQYITPRQLEVWRLVALGLTRKEIAAELNISVNGVPNHLRKLYKSINAHKTADVTRAAVAHRVITVDFAP